ncbi:hypothetical protein [Mesorhizobium sp. 1B3]|uniref:hypothetical protein n=1 Tax=Mesorhizobium sp. 1B3 TaxID=3243599 RepID=UPI003D98D9BC
MTSIAARLDKLEARMPAPQAQGRVFRVIVDEGEDEGAKLAELGFSPDSNDFAIIHRIVHPKRGPHHG